MAGVALAEAENQWREQGERSTPSQCYGMLRDSSHATRERSRNTMKVLEENIGSKISDIPCSNIFADMSPMARDIKERISKWEYNILKRLASKAYLASAGLKKTSAK